MKINIIGNGLTSLTLAKTLVNQGIYVDIFPNIKTKSMDKNRTIGISKSNIDFFNENVLNIKKFIWKINKIEIYGEDLKNEKLLNFENNGEQLFSVIKNYELYNYLNNTLKKDKFFNYKKTNFKKFSFQQNELFINCENNNFITKKYFNKTIKKNYKSTAFTTTIYHKKLLKNDVAVQIFTKYGPIAFLPISKTKTSIVYSVKNFQDIRLEDEVKKYNLKYSIIKFSKISKVKLKSTNLRNYYYQNILAFGDLLHKIHPLAGQGFNMTIRDIKVLLKLIKFKINHGLELDKSIFKDFEKKTKHKNYIFSNGIDFVHEFFNLERKLDNPYLKRSIKLLGKNRYANSFFKKFADYGI